MEKGLWSRAPLKVILKGASCRDVYLFFIASGIGRDIAIQLSKCGANVIAVGRSRDLLGKNDMIDIKKHHFLINDLRDSKRFYITLQSSRTF